MLNKLRKGILASVIGIGFMASTSHAALEIPNPAYTRLVIFGDSLSDSGNNSLVFGNNAYINLEPDDRAETDRLFKALADGGKVEMALQEMFWGDYFGSLTDRFGVQWMFNCSSKA